MSEVTEFRGGRDPDADLAEAARLGNEASVEPEILYRTFSADLTPGDGRTVDCRIVPYGERIEHNDGLGGVPLGMPYLEEWSAGAFQAQERAAHRVLANMEHEQGIGGVIGHGLALRDSADGLYGSFKFHETPDGDKALLMVKEGILDTVSLEARPLRSERTSEGVVKRVKAHLAAVAFARFGAYKGAVVLAVRERATIIDEVPEELLPVDMDAETVERCRRLGLSLPERYEEAHPAETDTPAGEADTPESGTRPDDVITTTT